MNQKDQNNEAADARRFGESEIAREFAVEPGQLVDLAPDEFVHVRINAPAQEPQSPAMLDLLQRVQSLEAKVRRLEQGDKLAPGLYGCHPMGHQQR